MVGQIWLIQKSNPKKMLLSDLDSNACRFRVINFSFKSINANYIKRLVKYANL